MANSNIVVNAVKTSQLRNVYFLEASLKTHAMNVWTVATTKLSNDGVFLLFRILLIFSRFRVHNSVNSKCGGTEKKSFSHKSSTNSRFDEFDGFGPDLMDL